MRKRTSAADPTPVRVVIVTMDTHVSSAAMRAQQSLRKRLPGLTLQVHAATDWDGDPAALDRCQADIGSADLVIVTMLFLEDHYRPVIDALRQRREHCDAMICCLSAGEVVRLTRLGKFIVIGHPTEACILSKSDHQFRELRIGDATFQLTVKRVGGGLQ